MTIECVGEFWGIDTDKGLYDHVRCYWRDWFPALGRIHRTTFVPSRSSSDHIGSYDGRLLPVCCRNGGARYLGRVQRPAGEC